MSLILHRFFSQGLILWVIQTAGSTFRPRETFSNFLFSFQQKKSFLKIYTHWLKSAVFLWGFCWCCTWFQYLSIEPLCFLCIFLFYVNACFSSWQIWLSFSMICMARQAVRNRFYLLEPGFPGWASFLEPHGHLKRLRFLSSGVTLRRNMVVVSRDCFLFCL